MIDAARKLARCHCGLKGVFGYQVDGHWQWFCAEPEHRLRRWSSDFCVDEAEGTRALAKLFEVEVADPPDLQKLVAEHGSYSKVPAEVWAEFDRAMEGYRLARGEKYRNR